MHLQNRTQILLACMLSISLAASLRAQVPTAELHLSIHDPSGAPMQASGRLRNTSTKIDRTFQTDPQGQVTLIALPQGSYQLELSQNGFSTQRIPIDVTSSAPVTRTVTMQLGVAASQLDVVAATPIGGDGIALAEIPAPVQTATRQEIEASGALDLSDLLNRRLSGVHINENQGNPFQPDVNYRGYTGSPLLGTPQGISVYLDGVRQNQPFGDVVSWDLIPRIAIEDVALIPGSNPLFGLNTLGGAISVSTKDGISAPGTTLQASGGSFGRRAVEFEHGGTGPKGLNFYLAGNLFHEDGWRIASPSDVRQAFAKLGWQSARTSLALSFAYAGNSLTGNGLQEQRFLARDYTSGYTLGDVTKNHSPFFNLSLRHANTRSLTFSGNAYFRYIRTDAANPNLNTNSLDESVYQPSAADQAALKAAGYSGYPASGATAANTPFPFWRCIAQSLQHAEPSEKCNGIITNSATKQNNYGLSGQLTWRTSPAGRNNQFTAGSAWDRGSLIFQQNTQFAYINPNYSLTPVNSFGDGTTDSNGIPFDTRVNLHGAPQTWSLYATDTLALNKAWSFTVSGRFNRTGIANKDRFQPGGGAGSLNGNYVFSRLNPAAGFTYRPLSFLSAYANYSESSRAPTSIELGCADPQNPCNLPNALAGDPPLKQVVTRTVEAGLRGSSESKVTWSAGWFLAENRNDLLFVSSLQTGNGYFRDFGQTRRQGLEAHLNGSIHRLTLGGNYTFLSATYESPESLTGSSNSANDSASAGKPGMDGTIQIQPGNRIPLTPQHLLKAYADLQATSRLSAGLDFAAVSRSYARGNENNLSRPDGTYYLGPGSSPGYGVINFVARYHLQKHLQLFAQINNLLDHHYYSASQLGPTGFNNQGNFISRPFPAVAGTYPLVHATFYAPGAPLGVWGGLRFKF